MASPIAAGVRVRLPQGVFTTPATRDAEREFHT
jgi:hypothetical protein